MRAADKCGLATKRGSGAAGASLLVALLMTVGCGVDRAPATPRLRLAGDATTGWFVELTGLDRRDLAQMRSALAGDLVAALAVRTSADAGAGYEAESQPGVLGSVEVVGDVVRWEARYALVGGQGYVAEWRPLDAAPGTPPRATLAFASPAPALASTTAVEGIYPSASEVPANLLRLYIQFSAPMSQGRAADYIEISANGEPLDGAFVVPERELWSPDGDRLTLFFDPGRLKKGVGPNLQVGAPLERGDEVSVRVAVAWPDARGAPLRAPFEQRYRVGREDRSRPDPADWQLGAPATAGDPVILDLPEALDRALLERLLTVETASGERVDGTVEIIAGERRWRFQPRSPWTAGRYAIRVRAEIEDLAGNSVERLFDEPLQSERVGEAPLADLLLHFELSSR